MTDSDGDYLIHYGILRRSGRYPWGSGGPETGGHRNFLGYAADLKKQGLSEQEIAKAFSTTITELRQAKSIAKNELRAAEVAMATRLNAKGLSNVAIGQRMKIAESQVRALLNPVMTQRRDILQTTASMLEDKLKSGGYLDIGAGTENYLGISATQLATAVGILRTHGYEVHNVQVNQQGTSAGKKTTIKVLAPPGTTYGDINKNQSAIKPIQVFSNDGGKTYNEIQAPVNVSSSRIAVRYANQGGAASDGVIFVRPGVPDLSLGGSNYAQVRIAVDGTHYLKGMAVYKSDLPKGVDLQFNTNKSDTGNKLDAMKVQKADLNPFGSSLKKQLTYTDAAGKTHLSAMNIVNEQGDWTKWSRSLSSQFLSKQSPQLAKRQLDLALSQKKDDLAEILRLTNPVVKQKLLETFADNADSSAVHLKAAALPRQATHVILPIEKMKPTEVYAPGYENGTKVVLVRHPHGGTFEIPELTVNNKNAEAKKAIGTSAPDAIGISPKVAERLSGADFDGDTVLVIPNGRGEIKTSPQLKGLEHFTPTEAFPAYNGMKTIDGGTYNAATRKVEYGPGGPKSAPKQQKMGDISNLITDMTIQGANSDELARAVRHSMVVIDSEKHALDYKRSYTDNGIAALKLKYQGKGPTGRLGGASTIVSRAGSETRVPDRRLRPASQGGPIDKATGKLVYVNKDNSYVNKAGITVRPTARSTKLAETADARTLLSKGGGMPIERVYADHSNSLKALANEARKASLTTGKLVYSPTAAKVHAAEVKTLNAKLALAVGNKPRERQAQLIANARVTAKTTANPHLDSSTLKKIKGQALEQARASVGAGKDQIKISPEEWQAIQSGAISTKRLKDILDNADIETFRKLATPREATVVTPARLAIIKARLDAGYTQAEIAASLGIPVSTLNSTINR